MSAKVIFVLCAQALLVKCAMSQCIGGLGLAGPYGLGATAWGYDGLVSPLGYDGLAGCTGRGLAYDGFYSGIGPAVDFTPTSGGALPVSSASAIAPVGISVASENMYEGILAAAGELPFVGTVGLEGVLPTAGLGAVNHACGNGINVMASGPAAYGIEYGYGAIAPGIAAPALGYRNGLIGRGCGCAL